MRRALAVLVVLAVVCVTPPLAESGRQVRTGIVVCSPTRGNLISAQPARQDLYVQNAGTLHVNVGFSTVMFTLHAGTTSSARLPLPNYQGGLECQTQAGTGSSAVEFLEVIQ